MYLCFLIFPIWANRRARRRFSRILQATRGTPSRSLDLFSMYMVFYVFVFVAFSIYWVCLLVDLADCWQDPECGASYFRTEVGVVEFWYLVAVQGYALLVMFALEVHSHWVPVPYSGNVTADSKTTVYSGQMRTVYSNGTTTVMSGRAPATVHLPISTVHLPISTETSTETSTEISTVYQPTTVYLYPTETTTEAVLRIVDTTTEGFYVKLLSRYVTETPQT